MRYSIHFDTAVTTHMLFVTLNISVRISGETREEAHEERYTEKQATCQLDNLQSP